MLAFNVIEKSQSPLATPISLVKKKDGKYRFCVDFSKLNQLLCLGAFHMGGVCFIISLDIKSGYWQISIPEDSKLYPIVVFFNFVN